MLDAKLLEVCWEKLAIRKFDLVELFGQIRRLQDAKNAVDAGQGLDVVRRRLWNVLERAADQGHVVLVGPKAKSLTWRAASGCGKGNSETLWFKASEGSIDCGIQ